MNVRSQIPSSVDDVSTVLDYLLLPLSILFWIVTAWYVWTLGIPRAQFAVFVIGGAVSIYTLRVLADALRERSVLDSLGLVLAGAFTVFMSWYMIVNFEDLFYYRTGYGLWFEYIFAGVMIAIIVYFTYREFGLAFTGVALFVLFYVRWGYLFPGLLEHRGFSWERMVMTGALEFSGIYGSLTQLVGAWIALLLLYAGLLRAYGAFDIITRIASRTAELVESGVAQSAVIASLIIGMINGAQTANAAMTGSFTIPLMKDNGIKGKTAGGIEAVASSGGQIMPPVMGAAAFVMAALLETTYTDVLLAGIIPAVIFYVSVAAGVHYRAMDQLSLSSVDVDIESSEHFEGEKTRGELFADGVKFLVPFLVLIYTLGIAQFTVSTAGLYTVVAMIVFGICVPIVYGALATGDVLAPLVTGIRQTAEGMKYGLEIFAPIVIIIAVVNLIVDLLSATGTPGMLSLFLLDLSGGSILLGVLLAMAICILLGMGMPTVAAYTLVALLIAPTLTGDFAVPDMAAHYFVFYAAMLSGITPPIAVAVVVTSGIAESDFWATCFEAVRIAIVLFVLPFAFIFNPEIVTDPVSPLGLFSALLMLLGALSMVHSLNYKVVGMDPALHHGSRLVYFAVGLLAIAYPGEYVRIGAIVVFLAMVVLQHLTWGIHVPESGTSGVPTGEADREPT